MEVKDARCTFITNQEVLACLSAAKSLNLKQKDLRQHNTILYETCKYLKETPAKDETEECVKECIKSLQFFKLTAAEVLQILNHRPTSDVDLRMIIEECEDRMDDQAVDNVLALISKHLSAKIEPLETTQ